MSEGLDEIIHQPVRLKIMAALTANPPGEGLDFTQLKKLTGATDGNLGAHLDSLTRAAYVDITKKFVARRPKTTAIATPKGRKAFSGHVAFLRDLIDGAQ